MSAFGKPFRILSNPINMKWYILFQQALSDFQEKKNKII